jgi:DNA-binding IclR family transcriptional regulator
VDVGSRFPAFISATGRLVAAFSGLSDKDLERRFKSLRWDKAPEFSAWKADVEAARRDGYSMDRNNYINGVVLIAVPLLDSHDRMTHALVTAGLAEQLDEARAHALARDLQAEARALSQLLAARS